MSLKNRKQKTKTNQTPSDLEPTLRPSEVMRRAGRGAGASKPLVELSEDDLRAAGVTFTETGVPRIPGLPVQLNSSGEFWEEGGIEEIDDEEEGRQNGWDSEDEEAVLIEGETETETDVAISLFWDEFFDSMLYTVPFSFLYLMLDIMTNMTYMRDPGVGYYFKNYVVAFPTIGMLVFYSNRHLARSKLLQFVMTATSAASGMRVLWLVNKASYIKVMEQGPAAGTLWIMTIVLLSLGRAVLALAVVGGWAWYRGLTVKL